MTGTAVFPGSFDPLTVAHVAIAEAALSQLALDRVELVMSRVPLAKDVTHQSPAQVRLRHIEERTRDRKWLRARITEVQLVVDIAVGYDVVILGADKWHQLHDVSFYGGSTAARDAAIARLPQVAVAPRAGVRVPEHPGVVELALPEALRHVSSTAVRRGRDDWRA